MASLGRLTARFRCSRLPRSTGLGFTATNEVLSTNGYRMIDEAAYKLGCRYTTPERFNFHIELPEGSALGHKLGGIFDATYVQRVSDETAGLYDGIEQLLRSLALSGHPQVGLHRRLSRAALQQPSCSTHTPRPRTF